MYVRKDIVKILVSMLVGVGLASSLAVASESHKVLNLLLTYDPKSLDPAIGLYAAQVKVVVECLFEPLVRFDFETQSAVPALARSWEVSPDGLVWTFKLRDDVVWSDGVPVTAHDVEFSFKRLVDPAVASPLSGRLILLKGAKEVLSGESNDLSSIGVEALDDYTVRFTLAYPAPYFLVLVASLGFPAPQHAVEEYGEEWTDPANIVTDGPFLMKNFIHYNKIDLVKNPDYYDAQNVDIDEVHFIYVDSESTGLAMYEAGEVDTASVPFAEIDRVKSDPVLSKEFVSVPWLATQEVQFNTSKPPFDNVLVRKAFAAATDRDTIVQVVMRGTVEPALMFTPPNVVGRPPDSFNIGIPYNPEKARAYLAAAGYPGGEGFPEVTFAVNATESNLQLAQTLQKIWQDVLGVKVNVLPQEGRAYWENIVAGNYQFWRMGSDGYFPDEHEFLYFYYDSNFGENVIRWHNEEYDRLVEEADRLLPGDPRRTALYARAEEILVEEQAAIIPINYYAMNIVTKPYLKRLYRPDMLHSIKDWKLLDH